MVLFMYTSLIVILICFVYLAMPLSQSEGFQAEAECRLISSRGILYACDVHSSNPVSSSKRIDIDLSTIQYGQTVYLQGSALAELAKQLDRVPHPFILITGDCDESIPDDVLNKEEFMAFIESDKIIHWFSQNCLGTHPKLSQIPIGLDYHTRTTSDKWGPIMSPLDQEAELLAVKQAAKPFYQRKIQAYANFHFSGSGKHTADRADAKQSVPPECVWYEPNFTKTRLESFQHQVDYAFVISPHGNGLDCHRTWEALALGCIPIVKTSVLDPLFLELPVLVVKNWSDITLDVLTKTVEEFKGRTFNYDKLLLRYWLDTIEDA